MDKQGILNCLSEFPIKRVEFEKMRTSPEPVKESL